MAKTKQILSKRLLFSGQQLLLIKQGEHYQIPEFDSWPQSLGDVRHMHRIGSYSHYVCHVGEIHSPVLLDESYVWLPLKSAMEQLGLEWFNVAARAYQIINWDKNHHYCGQCGQKTQKMPEINERRCKRCNLFFYPRISPSIIVMIHKGKQILLARKPEFAPGIYGLIAGFVEPGESLEEALHREVKEEVGITVNNIRYFGSQPWPFPDSLMIAFEADYVAGEIRFVDGEIEAAGWYDADHFPGLPSSSLSIARQLIDSFLAT